MFITTHEQNTAEWFRDRLGKITGSRAKNLVLENYSTVDPEVKRRKLQTAIEQQKKLYLQAKQLEEKTDDVKKKQEQSEKWRAKIADAKTTEKAEEFEQKAISYEKQAEELREKHVADAEAKRVQADQMDEALDDLGLDVAKAETAALRLKTTQDLWTLFAEEWADPSDGENAAERGHRLEDMNASIVVEKLGINPDTVEYDTRMWISSENENIAVSPDVSEKSDKPTWAIECKSLGNTNHLKYVLPIIAKNELKNNETDELWNACLKIMPEYVTSGTAREFDFVPDDYKRQVIQYFVVNPDLQKVYFTFYNDRFYSSKLAHQFVTIERETVENEIEEQKRAELETLSLRDTFSNIIGALF